MSETTIITRKDGFNNNSGYYNEIPGMGKSYQNTPNPYKTDFYTSNSVSVPLPYLNLEFVPSWRVVKNNELRRDPGNDKFHLAFEAKPHLTMTSSSDGKLSSTNFETEARIKGGTPLYDLKYVKLGSDLQLYGSYNQVNSVKSMATVDLAVNSFNLYLNGILGSPLDISYQYYANTSIDMGEAGGSSLYNDIYGIYRNSVGNQWQKFNLTLPINDVINGGLTTFEGYYKQDLRDADNTLLGLSLSSRIKGKEGGGFSVSSEMGGISSGKFKLNAGVGFEVILSKRWMVNTTVWADDVTSEYGRSSGVALGFTGDIWGMIVKANLSASSFNNHAADNPITKKAWTTDRQTLTTFFSYDQTGAPTQITHKIELKTPSLYVSDGQPLELIIGTDNPKDTDDKPIKGVVVKYTDENGVVSYLPVEANITLSKIEIYDTSVAANNNKVEDFNFSGATLDSIANDGSPAKCRFNVKDPLHSGYKSYKIVVYCTTNTGDLGGIGPDMPGISLSATLQGKLSRLEN